MFTNTTIARTFAAASIAVIMATAACGTETSNGSDNGSANGSESRRVARPPVAQGPAAHLPMSADAAERVEAQKQRNAERLTVRRGHPTHGGFERTDPNSTP